MLVDLYGILKKCGICFILVGCKCSLCYWCDFIGINIVEGGIVLCVDMYLVIKLSGCYLSVMEEGYVFVVQKELDISVLLKLIMIEVV